MIRDRINITNEDYEYKNPCDLCDEMNFPQIGWKCINDDPYIVTNICYKCLSELPTILSEKITYP